MAVSLAFHIVFAMVGMAMPLLMAIAEYFYLKTKDEVYLILAKRWAKGTAILFAVGAVSGTVLSFELGLLWPEFMRFAGPIIGMPFSLEGFAFFLEAIFLGIYLYGWRRIPPRAHWWAGVAVFVSGTLSGMFVLTANAWMNAPAGFTLQDGKIASIDPWAAMFNAAAPTQVLHMTLAAFLSVGFAVAAIHGFRLLRDPRNLFHRKAFLIALAVGAGAAFLQPFSGDLSARHVFRQQPVKLAAMEGQWETERGAPLRIGGWPDQKREETRWALLVPKGLSFLATGDPNAEIMGLKAVPPGDRPPVAPVHVAFQVMVGCGTILFLAAACSVLLFPRMRRGTFPPWFLRFVVFCGPLGIIATQAGWVVTEVGRQPWVIYGIMRTADAVTPMPGLIVPFLTITLLYVFLGAVVVVLLKKQVFQSPEIYRGGGRVS